MESFGPVIGVKRQSPRLMRVLACSLLSVSALVFTVFAAEAATTYHYQGANFNTIIDRDAEPGTYTTSMSVSGSVTLSSPLGPNRILLGDGDVTASILAFSFTDGRKTYTETSLLEESRVFLFATDSLGTITEWWISLSPYHSEPGSGGSSNGWAEEVIETFHQDSFDRYGSNDYAVQGGVNVGDEAAFEGPNDPSAWSVVTEPECNDRLDNDGNGFCDTIDSTCSDGSLPGDANCPYAFLQETPICADGVDNDGDGFVDFDDPECTSLADKSEWLACGLGFELVLALPLVSAARRLRRHVRRSPNGPDL